MLVKFFFFMIISVPVFGANAQLQCGAGLHAGGAVPGYAGIPKTGNASYATGSNTYYLPMIAGENTEVTEQKQTCPYGKCSCGVENTVSKSTQFDISWVDLKEYSGDASTVFSQEVLFDNSHTVEQQSSNLLHILGQDQASAKMGAIELYEDFVAVLGQSYEQQIRELLSASINAVANGQMPAVQDLYNALIEQLPETSLDNPPAALTAYRMYLKGES